MKKILLLSDTHNYLGPKVLKYVEGCDEVWHAGDIGTISICDEIKKHKPLIAVYGNIDGIDIRKEYPLHQRFTCEAVNVWMTHIGGSPGKYNTNIRQQLESGKVPKLFICGHSHILKVVFDKRYNMLYMNPGAAGNYGIHKIKTLIRFSIEGSGIKNLEIIEIAEM